MAETVTSKKNKNQQQETAEMSFWDHLDALRGHLFRSAIAIVVFFIAAFINRTLIFDDIILAPKEPTFFTNRMLCQLGEWLKIEGMCLGDFKLDIVNLNLSGQFTTHMAISFFVALVLAIPYIIWEFWRFLKPALYEKERQHSKGAVLVMSLLFITGVLFSYFLIVPLTINFFGSYHVSASIANQISLASYISTFLSVTLWMGIIFELPVLVYFLAKIGIVTPAFLKKIRKYMIVVIITLAAIITPPDVISQILVSIPLFGLYELSIWIAGRTYKEAA
ncbi:MAG TPA: twin-arginine translocase subunit TatC [Lentimicrobium sp.]|nr:twin-arginine translocase subunit TatC [Lentimicrobium sp.]